VLLILLAGCAAYREYDMPAVYAAAEPDSAEMLGTLSDEQRDKLVRQEPQLRFGEYYTSFGAESPEEAPSEAKEPASTTKRLMIYTGRFELLVANVKDSVVRLLKKVESFGGYLQSQENETVTCRIPADRFQEAVDALSSFGVILSESVRAQDVTKQYFDLELRIETAEKMLSRLLALLDRAEKMEDTLKIEKEVRRLTEEIERLKGELRFLKDQIALSTLEVHFRSNAPPPRPVRGRTQSPFYWINRVGVEHVLERF
jgi:hypothetical protein